MLLLSPTPHLVALVAWSFRRGHYCREGGVRLSMLLLGDADAVDRSMGGLQWLLLLLLRVMRNLAEISAVARSDRLLRDVARSDSILRDVGLSFNFGRGAERCQ